MAGTGQTLRNPVLSVFKLETITTSWASIEGNTVLLMMSINCIVSLPTLALLLQTLMLTKLKSSYSKQHQELPTRMIDIHLMTELQADRMNRACEIAFDRKHCTCAWDNTI